MIFFRPPSALLPLLIVFSAKFVPRLNHLKLFLFYYYYFFLKSILTVPRAVLSCFPTDLKIKQNCAQVEKQAAAYYECASIEQLIISGKMRIIYFTKGSHRTVLLLLPLSCDDGPRLLLATGSVVSSSVVQSVDINLGDAY